MAWIWICVHFLGLLAGLQDFKQGDRKVNATRLQSPFWGVLKHFNCKRLANVPTGLTRHYAADGLCLPVHRNSEKCWYTNRQLAYSNKLRQEKTEERLHLPNAKRINSHTKTTCFGLLGQALSIGNHGTFLTKTSCFGMSDCKWLQTICSHYA